MQFYYLTHRRFSKSIKVPPNIFSIRLIVFHSRTQSGTHVPLGATSPQSPAVGTFPVLVRAGRPFQSVQATAVLGLDFLMTGQMVRFCRPVRRGRCALPSAPSRRHTPRARRSWVAGETASAHLVTMASMRFLQLKSLSSP